MCEKRKKKKNLRRINEKISHNYHTSYLQDILLISKCVSTHSCSYQLKALKHLMSDSVFLQQLINTVPKKDMWGTMLTICKFSAQIHYNSNSFAGEKQRKSLLFVLVSICLDYCCSQLRAVQITIFSVVTFPPNHCLKGCHQYYSGS